MQGVTGKGEVFQRYYTTFLLGGLLDSETESRDLKHDRISTEIIDRKQFNSPRYLDSIQDTLDSIWWYVGTNKCYFMIVILSFQHPMQ